MGAKDRFFIYGRKEMLVLTVLAALVAAFAFTLGLHLGVRLAPEPPKQAESKMDSTSGEHEGKDFGVKAAPDEVPERHELADYMKKSDDVSDDYLDKRLHEEVTKTGLKVDVQRQLELPKETQSENAGATTLEKPKKISQAGAPPAAPKAATNHETVKESVPPGHFTLQVGSYKTREEAKNRAEMLEGVGKKAFIRVGKVSGQEWYRVYVGGFESRKEAEVNGARFKSDRVIDSFVVSKMP